MKSKKEKELHPKLRVRMALNTVATANKMLPALSKANVVHESWPKMLIYMSLTQFAEVMVHVSKMESPPTWKQLNVDIVDMHNEPTIIHGITSHKPQVTA